MSMRTLVIIGVVLLALLVIMSRQHSGPVQQAPGVLIVETPRQTNLAHGATLQRGDVMLTTRAHFDITARVLSRKDYGRSNDGDLIPVDLALGWGRMSDSDVLSQIDISQSGRFYRWHVTEFPIPRREIETSSANMHIIPASADVERMLKHVRSGEVVRLQGFLVDASRKDGWHWKTSMTRNDTGGGACELVYVEELDIAPL